MYNTKERKRIVPVTVQLNYSLGRWLRMEIGELGLIFDFSVRIHNVLRANRIERLEDLLLFSRKGFTDGTGLTTEEFEALTFNEQRRVEYLEGEGKYKVKLVNPDKPLNRNLGKAGMQEIDAMLEKLGLKFRGE
ncbi:MAG: hypothetical protein H6791_02635 [Candidatus Nomurabacteria bacterium]|nr:hypothetical protein [Flavobacteriales bacterium]USN94631.1 MAG: hypothetical protein H6791_02635 [Candidatus Nomurabacteria bacterium]